MAQHKSKKQRIADALKAIKKHKLFFVTDVPPHIGISTARFYQLELEKVEDIKDALELNRIEVKTSMRNIVKLSNIVGVSNPMHNSI